MARSPDGPRRRSRTGQRRHKVTIRLSPAEKAAIDAAASRAGLATGAWIGQAAMDAAEHRTIAVPALYRQLLGELNGASALLRQAAERLADGGRGASECSRAARQADAAAVRVARALAR